MRERLTFSFVTLSVVLLLGAGIVRSFLLLDLFREQESAHVQQEVVLVSEIVAARQASGDPLDREFLSSLVGADTRLEYDAVGQPAIVVHGASYEGSDDPEVDLSASSDVNGARITIGRSPEMVRDIIGRDIGSVLVMFLLIALIAGTIGLLISRALSAPFRQLAVAAAALGRGRFDLELPRTKIPEARAIAQALATSAAQLEDRLRRERDFAEHASHMLRTPLTGLRLELEELSLRPDVPDDVKATAVRGLATVDEMNAVAGELVEIARSGSLVEGAAVALVDLATQLAQRWSDRLAVRGRSLSASAEGDLTLTYTPGPVEHVLDLLLAEVVLRGSGAVRLVFRGEEGGHLRITVSSEASSRARSGERVLPRMDQARTVVDALGGRLTGEDPATGLEVLLPRR